jgi:hypothetical protein
VDQDRDQADGDQQWSALAKQIPKHVASHKATAQQIARGGDG